MQEITKRIIKLLGLLLPPESLDQERLVPDVTLSVIKPNWLQGWYYGRRALANISTPPPPPGISIFGKFLFKSSLPGTKSCSNAPSLRKITILQFQLFCSFYCTLYNNPSYSRILIGSCLWSIRGQTHLWRHHYRVFASAVLKWRKVLRIRITFYVTGQKIRYKQVLPRHWTGSRSQ